MKRAAQKFSKRPKQKAANLPKQKKASLVRIEPDVAKDVAVESKRNGRTVQGEVNSVLRDHYSSKWDVPPVAAGADALRRF